MERKILENHQRYLERKKLYRNHGFDIDKERQLILESAEPLSADILEVGTGTGHFTLILARGGYKFVSVDISENEQEIAKLNLRYFGLENSVDFRIEDAENLSFKDNSFDTVFSVNTVHHLANLFRVMDEFARVVSGGGKIILSDFTGEGFKILDKIHAEEGRVHKKAELDLNDVNDYFLNKGFKTDHRESRFQEILTIFKPVV